MAARRTLAGDRSAKERTSKRKHIGEQIGKGADKNISEGIEKDPVDWGSMKFAVKDSVFCDMFAQKKYLFQLYQALHPEDVTATVEDLDIVTIERVVSNGEYNDVGFTAGGHLVVLVEEQTKWSPNIVTRMLLYLAETYKRHLRQNDLSLHNDKLVEIPVPELYVIYPGKKNVPDCVTFRRDVLGDNTGSIELEVRVLRGEKQDIVGEYVEFTKVVDEVRADSSIPFNRKAIEVVHLCIERGILAEYMHERGVEAESIMDTVFDQEWETRHYHKRLAEELTEEITKKVTAEITDRVTVEVTDRVTAEVTDRVTAEVTDRVTDEVTDEVTNKVTEELKNKFIAEGMAAAANRLAKSQNLTFSQALDILCIPEQDRATLEALAVKLS